MVKYVFSLYNNLLRTVVYVFLQNYKLHKLLF